MDCPLLGTEPLSKPMLVYCFLDPYKLQRHFNQNTKLFIHKNVSEDIVCEMAAILSKEKWSINSELSVHIDNPDQTVCNGIT